MATTGPLDQITNHKSPNEVIPRQSEANRDGGPADDDWRQLQGDAGADSCALVGKVRFTVPSIPGQVGLDLRLVAGDVTADNCYLSRVI